MRNRRGSLGIITNNRHGVFQAEVLQGISEEARQAGYEIAVDSLAEDDRSPARAIALDPAAVAGLLVIANAASDDYLRRVHASGIPISLVSHQVPGTPVPAVLSNNSQGIGELVKHLVIRCKRHELVYIGGVAGQTDAVQRETAFQRELMRYNLHVPPERLLDGQFDPEIAASAVKKLVRSGAPFDAVLAADYLMAVSAIEELRASGIRVPQDVSVVGFGDAPKAEQAGLTTVAADITELGRRAARQLIGQIEGLEIGGVTVLSVELRVRASCGCHSGFHPQP